MILKLTVVALAAAVATLGIISNKQAERIRKLEELITQLDLDVQMLIQNNKP